MYKLYNAPDLKVARLHWAGHFTKKNDSKISKRLIEHKAERRRDGDLKYA